MSERSCLAGESTACNGSNYVELAFCSNELEGTTNFSLNDLHSEIIV